MTWLTLLFSVALAQTPPPLPKCVDEKATIAKVKSAIAANKKTSAKYDGYKSALKDDPPAHLAARLVYAEAIAARCKEKAAEIIPLIAAAVGNRIRIRKGDVASVVFQRDQFASSLNDYPMSAMHDFLCPSDLGFASAALAAVTEELAAPRGLLPADTVNYYLFQHDPKLRVPEWAKGGLAAVNHSKSKALDECVKFFRDPAFR